MSLPRGGICSLGWIGTVLALWLAPLAAAEPTPGPTPPPDATTPAAIDWQAVQAEEDRIDQLPAAEQTPALLDLRRRLPETASTAAQALQQRLTLKLNYLAALQAVEATEGRRPAPYADRLAVSKQAAEIGATYLKQNDPQRALAWVARSRDLADGSLWPDDLRNRIHTWYDLRLQTALAAPNFAQAREVLAGWKQTMGEDFAVTQAVERYAQTRAADLVVQLDSTDARTVLTRLREEEQANPGAPAWQTVRDRVAAQLDRGFQNNISSRNIPGAEAALAEQSAVARDFNFGFDRAPIASNRIQLDSLIRDLQPSPIQRAGGHVRAVQFRIEVMQTIGVVSYRHRNLTYSGVSFFPFAVGDWRIYNGDSNPWWFGFNMTGLQNNAGKNFQPTNRFTTEGFFLFGRRTATGSGSLGVGGVYTQLSFGDPVTQKFAISRSLSMALRLDWEQTLGANWTIYGTGEVGGRPGVSLWQIRVGTRYYFNHNFCVGLHALMTEASVAPDGSIDGYYVSMKLIGPSMLMQF